MVPTPLQLQSKKFDWRSSIRQMPIMALIVAASPHLKALTTAEIAGIQFDWLFYGAAIAFTVLRPRALFHSFPKRLVVLCLFSLISVVIEGMWNPLRQVVDILSLWVIYAAVFDTVLTVGFDRCFRTYFTLSVGVAAWGIVELLLGQVRTYGLDGFAFEPSHYVAAAAPAAFYAMSDRKLPNWIRFIVPVSVLLTFSTTGLVVISLISLSVFRRTWQLAIPVLLVGFFIWEHNDSFRKRVKDRLQDEAYEQPIADNNFGNNKTTVSLLSNWYVTQQSFKDYFPLGCGYSNHYLKYSSVFRDTPYSDSIFYKTNHKSAHNLTIRWVSEFGLIGILILVFLGYRLFKARTRMTSMECLVLVSVGMHFVSKSIKLGSYLDYGTPFFLSIVIVILHQSNERVS